MQIDVGDLLQEWTDRQQDAMKGQANWVCFHQVSCNAIVQLALINHFKNEFCVERDWIGYVYDLP